MLTEDKIIGIYCIIDDILKGIGHREDERRRVSDSEVITTALASALYFGGHLDNARGFMKMTKLVPKMLDKSRFNRRLHSVSELVFPMFWQLGNELKNIAGASEHVIDSFPVALCDNIRISRCKLLKGEQWRGRQSSMRRYFYGVKVQVMINTQGILVEFGFVPGCESDVQALKKLPMAVTPESKIYGDPSYTNYQAEDGIKEAEFIELMICRKSNSKRPDQPWIRFIKDYMRKGIETTFSQIKALFLRKIHAVTFKGVLIKLVMFILAFTLNNLTN
ncbi:IS982 family transposase [Terrimonas sp.]|uniref:IS982 family transposase n=1 Tax=Terrimonas sp. TaxID=1914338 RepID=UPI000D5158C1|nr:IS982 family transposase [Terrimonas sp.]PVD52515.1 IS982 family transposase [Terrimonas sp.]